MKVLLGFFVATGLVLYLVFHFGMSGYSPEEDAVQVREAIKHDMTYEEILEIRAPRRFETIRTPSAHSGVTRGPDRKLEIEEFKQDFLNDEFELGFVFLYRLADKEFEVVFDPDGIVVEINDFDGNSLLTPFG